MMFQLVPEGWQQVSQNDVVGQAVPELGSSDQVGSIADCYLVDLVRQNSELVLYAVWDLQPVKADECITDVVVGPQTYR